MNKKDIEVKIKVPLNWLRMNELAFLGTLGRGVRGKVSDRVIDGAVEKILKEIAIPKIDPKEIKDKMLTILAERALDE